MMKTVKHGHRNTGKANKVPRSATFNKKASPIAEHHTASAASKRRR